jgi:hypothetical protein
LIEQFLLQPIVGVAAFPGVWKSRIPAPSWLSTSGNPRPAVWVLQTNGCCCGPEKIGPVTGWFVNVSSAVGRPFPRPFESTKSVFAPS